MHDDFENMYNLQFDENLWENMDTWDILFMEIQTWDNGASTKINKKEVNKHISLPDVAHIGKNYSKHQRSRN